ncbi:ECF transporter S component [Clostridium sediminicola]|uniref:ECF transporter S component n=1 Tax=Clostridium sediminicola TaxID=3114879 RepID=UPI0031F25AB9
MNSKTSNLVKASLFLALGIIIPFTFHFAGIAGKVFLPMHIPVMLCGFILGEKYGALVGFITPLLSAVTTGMPPLFPIGVAMAFELATYGFVAGVLYNKKRINVLGVLFISMILGRLVSAIVNFILLSFVGKTFVFKIFITTCTVTALPGIVVQLLLIPVIIKALEIKGGSVLDG